MYMLSCAAPLHHVADLPDERARERLLCAETTTSINDIRKKCLILGHSSCHLPGIFDPPLLPLSADANLWKFPEAGDHVGEDGAALVVHHVDVDARDVQEELADPAVALEHGHAQLGWKLLVETEGNHRAVQVVSTPEICT